MAKEYWKESKGLGKKFTVLTRGHFTDHVYIYKEDVSELDHPADFVYAYEVHNNHFVQTALHGFATLDELYKFVNLYGPELSVDALMQIE